MTPEQCAEHIQRLAAKYAAGKPEMESFSDTLLAALGLPTGWEGDQMVTLEHKRIMALAVGDFFAALVLRDHGQINAVRTVCVSDRDPLCKKLVPGNLVKLGMHWSFSGVRELGDPCEPVEPDGCLVSVITKLPCNWIDWEGSLYVNFLTSAGSWHERELFIKPTQKVRIERVLTARSWVEMKELLATHCDWADSEAYFERWAVERLPLVQRAGAARC